MQLSARALDLPGTQNQWIKQLVITHNGQDVLDVTAEETPFGMMRVLVNGSQLVKPPPHEGRGANHGSPQHGLKVVAHTVAAEKRTIGGRNATKLTIKAAAAQGDDLGLTIFSAKAAKFDTAAEQVKFMHLNLAITGSLPPDASGVFAELVGAKPMSEVTKMMIQRRHVNDGAEIAFEVAPAEELAERFKQLAAAKMAAKHPAAPSTAPSTALAAAPSSPSTAPAGAPSAPAAAHPVAPAVPA